MKYYVLTERARTGLSAIATRQKTESLVRRPDLWAALMPVCGALPVHRVPGLAKAPTWCLHGALDTEVPVEGSRRVVELLQEAGGVVRYSELPAVGHNCTREVFSRSDLLPWLMEQRLSKTAG